MNLPAKTASIPSLLQPSNDVKAAMFQLGGSLDYKAQKSYINQGLCTSLQKLNYQTNIIYEAEKEKLLK